MNYKEERPWGTFENLLDNNICKVKQIIVKSGHALSYQYHLKRSEVWVVIRGKGLLILNDNELTVSIGDVIKIPAEDKHRIRNISDEDLIFIEVQIGDYFGEDDIVRLKDDYER